MSAIITKTGVLGPFKSVETLADRLRCDGVDYPFTVIGKYEISADDSLAPKPVPPPPNAGEIKAKILLVEGQQTARRVREPLITGDISFLAELETQIMALRAKLK